MEGARIHAENSIRQKNQELYLLELSIRLDAVAQRVQTAITMKQVTPFMVEVVQAIDNGLLSMNLAEVALFRQWRIWYTS